MSTGRLDRLVQRLESLSARERSMILLAAMAAVIAITDLVWLGPNQALQRSEQQRIEQSQQQLVALESQIRALQETARQDVNAPVRQRIAQLETETRQLDGLIEESLAGYVPASAMHGTLRDMLQSLGGLELTELRNLPPKVVARAEPGSAGADPKAHDDDAQALTQLYRHSVELTLRGNYRELQDYVQALESLPQRLMVDRISIQAGAAYPPARMVLRIHTYSFEEMILGP
jgi:MSHA biogenesis protein MshJ